MQRTILDSLIKNKTYLGHFKSTLGSLTKVTTSARSKLLSDRVVGKRLDGIIVTANKRESYTLLYKRNTLVMHLQVYDTHVYLKIPCSLDVQIITLLSAEPEANCFPVECNHVFTMIIIIMAATRQQCSKKERHSSTIFSIIHTIHYCTVST